MIREKYNQLRRDPLRYLVTLSVFGLQEHPTFARRVVIRVRSLILADQLELIVNPEGLVRINTFYPLARIIRSAVARE